MQYAVARFNPKTTTRMFCNVCLPLLGLLTAELVSAADSPHPLPPQPIHHVARVTTENQEAARQPSGLLPGWKAIALFPGESDEGPILRWESVSLRDAPACLRLAIAIDDRQARTVRALFAKSGEEAGRFDIRFASPFQLYEIGLSAAGARRAVQEGIRLELLEGNKPLWVIWQFDGPDTGANALIPHLMQAGADDPMEAFPERICSIASLQQFSWMGGCVLDGLWALGDSWRGQSPRAAARRQVELYVAGGGREGLWVEGTLPYATVARTHPDHPILREAEKYLLSKRDAEGCIISGATTTAEGNYTVAYPLAILAKTWKRQDLEDLAVLQLRLRQQRLVDEQGDLWLRQHRTSEGTHRTFPGWSRGVAWYALGLVRTLDELQHRDDLDDLHAEVRRVSEWIVKHQREDGLWGVFVGEPELTADTAGSAGIAAALAWAAQRGWADQVCQEAASKTLRGLKRHLTPDGFLTGMSPSNKREAGIALQRSAYRVNCQTAMGLMAQLIAAAEASDNLENDQGVR